MCYQKIVRSNNFMETSVKNIRKDTSEESRLLLIKYFLFLCQKIITGKEETDLFIRIAKIVPNTKELFQFNRKKIRSYCIEILN
jgi:hypothetical protein